jgi:hypothetical protein
MGRISLAFGADQSDESWCMKHAATQHPPTQKTDCFAVALTDETDLGLAMLILETEDGDYQPIAIVSTIAEARELARHDLGSRICELEDGGAPLCPYGYRVWAQGLGGEYRSAAEIGVPHRGKR